MRNHITADKGKRFSGRAAALLLASCALFGFSACGREEQGRTDPVREWVYVPEFLEPGDGRADYYDAVCSGDSLYYVSYEWDEETQTQGQTLCRYSLTERQLTKTELDWGDGGPDNGSLRNLAVTPDGELYGLVAVYSFDEATYASDVSYGLAKFGADGKLVFYRDVTEKLTGDSGKDYISINGFAIDGEGRIYIGGRASAWLFDREGGYLGSVNVGAGVNSYLQTLCVGNEGKVYAVSYSYEDEKSGTELVEIDFDNKKTGESWPDFVSGGSGSLTAGAEPGTFLITNGSTVYEYRLADRTRTALFDWLDSDINGDSVRGIGVTGDGRIVAIIRDWQNDESGIALLTKTKGSEAEQKEIILIGTLGYAQSLQAMAVKFNRSSDKYHISIRQYMDYSSYSTAAYEDAVRNLNNDLLSKTNCPDIVDLSGLDIRQLAKKGLLEDLGQFLSGSGAYRREDFVQSVLDAYTYDGVLAAVPTSFELATLIGRKADLGERQGWTMKEMMEYAAQHPGTEILDGVDRVSMLYFFVLYNADSFIDWDTGKCSFDSQEFRDLLTFAGSLPEETDYGPDRPSMPTRIQRGEVLLADADFYNFDEIQMYYSIFGGDITCIGFPTADGSGGTALVGDGLYAITTKARDREGAWKFLEKLLAGEESRFGSMGFPTLRNKLDEMARKAVEPAWLTDMEGNLILDGSGNPIENISNGSIGYGDGWSYEYRRATKEEADQILRLMESAKPIDYNNTEILKIISEDAAAYFQGDKSVDEVAKIIQSRVQVYVDTNR